MARNLTKELQHLGWDLGRERFNNILMEVFVASVQRRGWTDEDLLFHPYDAMQFCKSIRVRTTEGIPDELILRVLVGYRKNSGKPRVK